jgi:phosphatidylglycerophosphatase A
MGPRPARPAGFPSFAVVVATWFGCGYCPVAPGTAGSLAALLIAMALAKYWGWHPAYFGVLAAVVAAPAVWVSGVAAKYFGKKDPGQVVVDEVVGQWATLAGALSLNWKSWLGAFILFRLFDIWKPVPARQAENLPGGIGIVADDVVAGIYGALVLFAAGWFNLY